VEVILKLRTTEGKSRISGGMRSSSRVKHCKGNLLSITGNKRTKVGAYTIGEGRRRSFDTVNYAAKTRQGGGTILRKKDNGFLIKQNIEKGGGMEI